MKILNLSIATILVVISSITVADTIGYIAIPASAFSEKDSQSSNENASYKGNQTGTSRYFNGSMFAPIYLPHGSNVTSLACGSNPKGGYLTSFTLRRNEPQQANIDMASLETAILTEGQVVKGIGLAAYQFLHTESIISPRIDNSKFNYYIIAYQKNPLPNARPPVALICADRCANVNYCSVGYTIVESDSSNSIGNVTTNVNKK